MIKRLITTALLAVLTLSTPFAQQGPITTIVVQPADPTVSVTVTCDASPCLAPATFTYVAIVTNPPSGSIVRFKAAKNGGSLDIVGSDPSGDPVTSEPNSLRYTFVWTGVPAGSYQVTAERVTTTGGAPTPMVGCWAIADQPCTASPIIVPCWAYCGPGCQALFGPTCADVVPGSLNERKRS